MYHSHSPIDAVMEVLLRCIFMDQLCGGLKDDCCYHMMFNFMWNVRPGGLLSFTMSTIRMKISPRCCSVICILLYYYCYGSKCGSLLIVLMCLFTNGRLCQVERPNVQSFLSRESSLTKPSTDVGTVSATNTQLLFIIELTCLKVTSIY